MQRCQLAAGSQKMLWPVQQTPGCGANQDPSLALCLCLARLSSVPGTAQQERGQHPEPSSTRTRHLFSGPVCTC